MATVTIGGVTYPLPSKRSTAWDGKVNNILTALANVDGVGSMVVNVKDFGAVGDGVTDDTQAIQDAIDSASAAGACRHVHFPAGSYKIVPAGVTSGWHGRFVIPSNFTVSGDGTASKLMFTGVEGANFGLGYVYQLFFVEDGTTDVLFTRLWVQGENSGPFVHYEDNDSAAIFVEGSTCKDIWVVGCKFTDLTGFAVHAPANSTRVHVVDCAAENCANSLANVNANYSMLGPRNTVYNSEGFEFSGKYTRCDGNIMQSVLGVAISMGGDTTPGAKFPGCTAIGNIIDGCTDGGGIITAEACLDAVIASNDVRRCDDYGISVTNGGAGTAVGRGVSVVGNVISSNCKSGGSNLIGMLIGGQGKHLVAYNHCRDESESGFNQVYGCIVYSPNCTLIGNRLDGTTRDLELGPLATNTKLYDNDLYNNTFYINAGASISTEWDVGTATSDVMLATRIYSDTAAFGRFALKADGKMEWGSASGARDTNLYRSAADTLKTDDSFVAVGTVTGSNLSGSHSGTSSGTNSGDITLGSIGSSPATEGASLSGQALTLQPADATHGGVISLAAQTLGAGTKSVGYVSVGGPWPASTSGTSPQGLINCGGNYNGALILSSNLYLESGVGVAVPALKVANSHSQLSGAAIVVRGNDETNINDIQFYTTPTASVSAGATYGGALRMSIKANGDLAYDTNTLYGDAANNRIGVNNSSPTTALDVTGTITGSAINPTADLGELGAAGKRWNLRTYRVKDDSGNARVQLTDAAYSTYFDGYASPDGSSIAHTFDTLNAYSDGLLGQFKNAGSLRASVDYQGTVGAGLDSDGGYNHGHLKVGNYHLWVDSSGRLRIKSSAPSSDTDGTVVGTQS